MKKILVPYDFSDIALHALNFAADLAKKAPDCAVTLINVIEHPTPDTIKTMGIADHDPFESLYIKKLIEISKEKMDQLMADDRYKGVKLDYKIVLGHPFKEISEEIKTKGIELVIMGTSGATGAEEFLVGSNAERMVRYSKCPVVTIREKIDTDNIRSIVLASDFHEVPDSFVEHVKRIKNLFGAKLSLVKINTPSSFTTTRHDRKQMQEFVDKYGLDDVEFETYNYTNEEDGIVAYAEDTHADMIALGTKQRRGVSHFLSGSIAEDVVNHSHVPVWTFGLDN